MFDGICGTTYDARTGHTEERTSKLLEFRPLSRLSFRSGLGMELFFVLFLRGLETVCAQKPPKV